MSRGFMAAVAFGCFLGALIVLLSACPKPPPPPTPIDYSIVECPKDMGLPVTEDVCDGLWTPEGLPCVHCDVPVGCHLSQAEVYCTPACSDTACVGASSVHQKRALQPPKGLRKRASAR